MESHLDVGEWAKVVTSLSSIGFAVWYAWYTTTRSIPRMQEIHDKRLIQMQTDHDKRIDKLLDIFRNETAAQREMEQARANQSIQLAHSGHQALHQVTRAVDDLRNTIHEVKKNGGTP